MLVRVKRWGCLMDDLWTVISLTLLAVGRRGWNTCIPESRWAHSHLQSCKHPQTQERTSSALRIAPEICMYVHMLPDMWMRASATAPSHVIPFLNVAAKIKTNISAEVACGGLPNWVSVCMFIVLGCFFPFSCLNYTLIDMFNTCAVTSCCPWREVSDKLKPALTNMQKHTQINIARDTEGGNLFPNAVSLKGIRFRLCFTN